MTMYSGYNGQALALRRSPDDVFSVWWDRPARIGVLRDESIRRAAQIGQEYAGRQIMVLYSGGLDSEWALEAFRAAGVRVTPFIVRYDEGLNEHDLVYARSYLERYGLTRAAEWADLDLRDWYKSEAQLEIARIVQTPELAYTGQYQAMLTHNRADRVWITGYDEPQLIADDSAAGERRWNIEYSERHYSVHKFFNECGLVQPKGGWIDAGVFGAYTFCPTWQIMNANLMNPRVWKSEQTKIRTLSEAFPEMVARPKYTGFENSLDIVVERSRVWQAQLMKQQGHKWLDTWRMNLNDVWRSLGLWHGA